MRVHFAGSTRSGTINSRDSKNFCCAQCAVITLNKANTFVLQKIKNVFIALRIVQ